MGLFGRVRTAERRRTTASADAEQGLALLDAARRRRVALAAPSTLAEAVITAAVSTVGVEAGSPLHAGLVDAALLGYACRISPGPVPDHARAAIEAHLVRTGDGSLDYESVTGIPDAVHALVRTATSLTASPATMAAATGVSEGAWASCCAAAASELRDNLLRSGLPDQPILEHAFLATMIRLGVVLGMIDELAEQSPESASPR